MCICHRQVTVIAPSEGSSCQMSWDAMGPASIDVLPALAYVVYISYNVKMSVIAAMLHQTNVVMQACTLGMQLECMGCRCRCS